MFIAFVNSCQILKIEIFGYLNLETISKRKRSIEQISVRDPNNEARNSLTFRKPSLFGLFRYLQVLSFQDKNLVICLIRYF